MKAVMAATAICLSSVGGYCASAGDEVRELLKRTDEAVLKDEYENALKVLSEAEKASAKAGDAELLGQVRERKKEVARLKAEYSRLKDDREKLEKSPDDLNANFTWGKFLVLKGDIEGALKFLSKGKEDPLKIAATKELAKPDKAPDLLALGDEWITAAKKHPALRRRLEDRAITAYNRVWSDLEGAQKEKLREQLRRLLQNPAMPPAKGLVAIKNWTTSHPGLKAGPSAAAAHSGKISFQVTCWKDPLNYTALAQQVQIKADKSYKYSVWALTDGTGMGDNITVHVQNAKGDFTLIKSAPILPDQPWFKRIEVEFLTSKDAVLAIIDVRVSSKEGLIYLDDLSVEGEDGKNLLKNPGFEER